MKMKKRKVIMKLYMKMMYKKMHLKKKDDNNAYPNLEGVQLDTMKEDLRA